MKVVFADTFYWVALTDPDDALYRQALEIEQQLGRVRVVTTDEVLTEFLAFFSRHAWMRQRAVRTVETLFLDPRVEIREQSRATFEEGFALYADRPDKQYSLTDCIAMATMRREGIAAVLTNDQHFEQEGFQALFRGRSN